ncbi:hypothetical protein ACVWXO_000922 [Bradyrhizobium sp. LM2.7]
MAETKLAAELAFDAFIESYALKYEKAADCLSKDRDTLLAFYDFPAEHWKPCGRRMRWTSDFFHDRDDDCRNRVRPFFCSAAPRAILPSRPSISQPPRAGAVKAGRVCGHRKAWP